MSTDLDRSTTWLGQLSEVRARVRLELERSLLKLDDDWMETPPTEQAVVAMADDLLALHESLRPLFLRWWEDGVLDRTTTIEGFTVESLHRSLRTRTVMATFTWLDGLVRDPEGTRRAIAEASRGPRTWRIRSERVN